MSRLDLKHLAAAVLSCQAVVAFADDELVIYALRDGGPASGVVATLDGEVEQPIGQDGSVSFDLEPGPHSVELSRQGQSIHSFRFDSANGQLVDVNVALDSDGEPQVSIERYFETETPRERLQAPTGTLSGRVSADGMPLAGAELAVRGTDVVARTDDAGRYEITLPRGVYELQITHSQLDAPRTEEVRVVSNVTKAEHFRFGSAQAAGAAPTLEEVVVVAKFQPSAFGESERFSVNILETIGIEQLARFGDTDVAGSVVRVPSVTVQNDRYIFIRGLGGRYITTTLNGSTMPSTDPTKREVPLDLFPANLVEQLDIKKTFIANMPGESTGGNLVINTRTFPEEAAGKLSLTLGFIPDLTGDDVYADPADGSWDFIGWDDGSREEPPAVEAIAALLGCGECQDEISGGVRQELGQVAGLLLQDNLDLDSETATPKVSLGANYGDVYYLGDSELGFFAAGNYRNGWSQRESGVQRTYEGDGDLADDFEFEEYSNFIEANGLLALGLNVGDSSYQSNTMVSRSTDNSVRVAQGFDGDQLVDSFRYSMEWVERQFISQQLAGEHVAGGSGLVANWQLTGSQARRYAPDRREVRFDMENQQDTVYNLEVPELVRRYDDLSDDNVDGSVDFEYAWADSTLSFGAQAIFRERDADSASYGYTGGQTAIDDNAPNLLVSDVIHSGNITGNTNTGYTFQDKTLASDSYEADMTLYGVYASYDVRFADVYQLVIGGRFEDYEQTTDTFEIQTGTPVQSEVDEGIFLPSLSFNWDLTDMQKLRFAASRTAIRPDFKETSNATFYDNEFDFRVRGNPLLDAGTATNFDLRWELYWSDQESVSVAVFYKDLQDTIERVVLEASGTAGNSRTFENTDAELYGVEVDGRRDFDLNATGSRSMFVALNASYIDSEAKLEGGETRKLQGQPDYTFNFVVGYDDFATRFRQEVTALLNQSGDAIVDVGILGQPDIIEEPRMSLDLNYKFYLSDDFVLRAKVRNLLDAEVEFTQGGQVFQKYKRGVELEAGIDWNF